MAELFFRNTDETSNETVTNEHPLPVALYDGLGNRVGDTGTSPLPVRARDDVTTSGILGALNAELRLPLASGVQGVAYELDAGLSGATVVVEATLDDATWFTINSVTETGIVRGSLTTTAVRGHIPTVNYSQVRLRVSVYSSGASAARLRASYAHGDIIMVYGLGVSQAPADTTTAGSMGSLQAFPLIWNGANWDRWTGRVGGFSFVVQATKQRPNDAIAYTANDVLAESASVGTVWSWAVGRSATGTGKINKATFITDDTTWVARVEVDLYQSTPGNLNDNVEATRLAANVAVYLGQITFPAAVKHTASSTVNDAFVDNLTLPFKCAASSTIFGIVRILDAVATPVAQKNFYITLEGTQD